MLFYTFYSHDWENILALYMSIVDVSAHFEIHLLAFTTTFIW